jgi:hypothetical protein
MLTIDSLLKHAGDFMQPYFEVMAKTVLHRSYKEHKAPIVRKAVIELLPSLATFNPDGFVSAKYLSDTGLPRSGYLSETIEVLINALKRESGPMRQAAFISLGKLALAVGHSVAKPAAVLHAIMGEIRDGLTRKRKNDDCVEQALICLECLARAVKGSLEKAGTPMKQVLEEMFSAGLSPTLVKTLSTMVRELPGKTRTMIIRRLVQELRNILHHSASEKIGDPTQQPRGVETFMGSVTDGITLATQRLTRGISSANTTRDMGKFRWFKGGEGASEDAQERYSKEVTCLALSTLSAFDLSHDSLDLVPFVHDCVVPFLDDSNPMIRKAAAVSCCKLLLPADQEAPTCGRQAVVVSEVLERLLMVGIGDADMEIRLETLTSIDARLDPLLLRGDSTRTLFMALRDEYFSIRVASMKIIGRLARRNPTYVMPALRQVLVQLLGQLEVSGDSQGKEESAMLLGELIKGAGHHVQPHALPILKMLMQRLHDNGNQEEVVTASLLSALGELSLVAGPLLAPYLDKLTPVVISKLQSGRYSEHMLEVALHTLRQLVSSTGYVVRPYFEYPHLMGTILDIIQQSANSESLRIEAMSCIGTLGIIDPEKVKELALIAESIAGNPGADEQPTGMARAVGGFVDGRRRATQQFTMALLDDEHHGGGAAGTMHTASLFLDPDAPAESAPIAVDVSSTMSAQGPMAHPVLQQQISIPGVPSNVLRGLQNLGGTASSGLAAKAAAMSSPFGARFGGGSTPAGSPARVGMRDRAETNAVTSPVDFQQQQVMLQQQEMIRQQQLQLQLGIGGGMSGGMDMSMTSPVGGMGSMSMMRGWGGSSNIGKAKPVMADVKMPPMAEEVLPSSCPSHVDYFNQIAVNGLMRILLDPRMATHHTDAVKAAMRLMQCLRQEKQQCIPLLKTIIPSFVFAIGRSTAANDEVDPLRQSLFEELTQLVLIVGADVIAGEQQMLTQLLTMAQQYWGAHLKQILALVQALSEALSDDFSIYLPELLPVMMQKIRELREERDEDQKRKNTIRVLRTLHSLAPLLNGFLHLVLPGLLRLVEHPSIASVDARKHGLLLLRTLCQGESAADYACAIVHPLTRLVAPNLSHQHSGQPVNSAARLPEPHSSLVQLSIEVLCVLVYKLGVDWALFVPTVQRVVQQQQPYFKQQEEVVFPVLEYYQLLVSRVLKMQPLPPVVWSEEEPSPRDEMSFSQQGMRQREMSDVASTRGGGSGGHRGYRFSTHSAMTRKFSMLSKQSEVVNTRPQVDVDRLRKAWETRDSTTREDWLEWMRRVSVELLRQSPSPSLRSCSGIAEVHQPLARELFNTAFLAIWPELHKESEDHVVHCIESALMSPSLPPEILQTLLNLAEFMDHDDNPLRDDLVPLLGKLAENAHAYAKALHYRELEVRSTPSVEVVEALIKVNNKLNQPEAAVGMLKYAQTHLGDIFKPGGKGGTRSNSGLKGGTKEDEATTMVQPSWFLELERWNEALAAYAPEQQSPTEYASKMAKIRRSTLMKQSKSRELDQYTPTKDDEFSPERLERYRGQMYCLQALGKLPQLVQLAQRVLEYDRHEQEQLEADAQIKRTKSMSSMGGMSDLKAHDSVDAAMRGNGSNLRNGVAPGLSGALKVDNNNGLSMGREMRVQVATLGAKAAFTLQAWDEMEHFTNIGDGDIVERPFHKAVLAVHRREYGTAMKLIDVGRKHLAPRLSSLVSESYSRAYSSLVMAQQFTELEEIIRFKETAAEKEAKEGAKAFLRGKWQCRMRHMQPNIATWRPLLTLHELITKKVEDMDAWLKFSSMLYRNGRFDFALTVLRKLRLERFLKFSHGGDEAVQRAASASSAASAAERESLESEGGAASFRWSQELQAEVGLEESQLSAMETATLRLAELGAEGFFGKDIPHPRVAFEFINFQWVRGQALSSYEQQEREDSSGEVDAATNTHVSVSVDGSDEPQQWPSHSRTRSLSTISSSQQWPESHRRSTSATVPVEALEDNSDDEESAETDDDIGTGVARRISSPDALNFDGNFDGPGTTQRKPSGVSHTLLTK